MPTRHDLTTRRGTFSSRRTYDSQTGGKLSTQSGLGFGTAGAAYGFSSMTGRQVTQSVDLSYPDAAADWTTNFAYDLDGRLVGAKNSGEATVAYSYAAAGHMLAAGSRTMTYTPAGRLASSVGPEGSVTYFFDSRGRRSRMVSVVASATYLYDAADQLVGFKRDNGKNGSIDVDAAYNYDAQGHRTRSVVTSAGATTTTFYAYEGLALLGLRSTTGGSTTRLLSFLYDASGNPYAGTASLPSGQSVVFGIVTTDRGDIAELVSESGEAFAYWRYDAFGQPLPGKTRAVTDVDASAAAAVASALALRYAGYVYDAESELYCAGRRFYDPKTYQFLTADPLRSDGEESLYQYCAGDPVGNTDPSGLALDADGTGRVTAVNSIATAAS